MPHDLETPEQETIPVLPETPSIRENLEALQSEVVGPQLEDMEDDEIKEQIDAMNDETLAFLKTKMASENREEAERARFQYEVYGATLVVLNEVRDLIVVKDFEGAEARVLRFLDEEKLRLQGMNLESVFIENAVREIQDFVNIYGQMVEQTEVKEPSMKMQLLSTGLDVVPFVGGAKILTEGVVGKTLAGEELTMKGRALHAAEGALWLTVDTAAVATGPAGALVEGAEMLMKAPKASKLLTRGAALIRATQGAGKGSRAIYNAGRFLVEHPDIAVKADKLVARGVEARKAALLAAPTQLEHTREEMRNSAEIIQAVNEERQELVDELGNIFDQNNKPA